MAKQIEERRGAERKASVAAPLRSGAMKVPQTGQFVVVGNELRASAVMRAAEASGLLSDKSRRIGGRVSPALLERAKKHTGIEGDTELIEFALANLALEDEFAQTFRKLRGTVDPSLKLGFERD